MNIKQPARSTIFVVAAICFMIYACTSKTEVSSNDRFSSYAPPAIKPFSFPAAKPIKWKILPQDSLPKASTTKFEVDKLPYKSFSANGFKPLHRPASTTPFNWNKLRTLPVHLDSLSFKPVEVRRFMLPEPVVTLASAPGITNKGTAGLTRLGPSEGLAGTKVFAVIEDRNGSTWISTERGLCRYTGTEFRTYNFFEKDPSGAVEILGDMELDSSGRLLMSGVTSGIYRIDINKGIVEHFVRRPGFSRIRFDHQGRFWAVKDGSSGLFQIDLDKHQIAQLRFWDSGAEQKNIYGLYNDKTGNFWIGFGPYIGIIDTSFSKIRLIEKTDGLPVEFVYDFDEDTSGKMWMTTYRSPIACAISLNDQTITTLGAEQGIHGIPYDMFTDKYNRTWIATNDTMYIFDGSRNRMKKMVTGTAISVRNFPSSGMQTSKGLLWLGTNEDGVLLIDQEGMLADHFSERNGLESNDVWGIGEDSKGRIWLANYKGINIYDAATERLYLLKFPPEISRNSHRQIRLIAPDIFFLGSEAGFAIIDVNTNLINFYQLPWKKSGAVTFTGVPDKDGALWISGGLGLLYYNINTKTFKLFDEENGLVSNFVFITAKDKAGRIWLCTEKGTLIINPEQNVYYTLTEESGLSGSYSSMYLESSDGKIYLGSDKGFSIFDHELKTITNVRSTNGLIPEAMYDMVEWNNRIHIGSENGIIIIDQTVEAGKPWKFRRYNKSAGFPYNDYNQSTAFVSSAGDAWWAASPVLSVVHQDPVFDTTPPSVQLLGITIMDQPISFINRQSIAASLAEKDTIQFGSKRYTASNLPPDSGYATRNNIQWDGLETGFQLPLALKLPYDQNSFSFSFANQQPKAREKIVYRFYLEGEDLSWSDPTEKPFSRIYYNIKPGSYSFKVITRGYNGIWSTPAALHFTVLPPWWQTWWAYLLFALLAAGIVYLIVRFRSKMLQKENKLLEKKVRTRTEALNLKMEELKATQHQLIQSEKMASLGELTAGIAHEIQNPLNFINNFSEINKELLAEMAEEIQKGDLNAIRDIATDIKSNEDKIHHHGRRADGIVKSMLQHSRSSVNINKEPTDLNKLADEYLRLAYHGLRAKDKSFNSGMKTAFDEALPPINMIQQDIGRVILNLLTNAFYAVNERAKTDGPSFTAIVTVKTNRSGNHAVLTVSDNGNGIPTGIIDKIFQPFFTTKPTGQGTGLGLSMSYDIITKAHHGELTVKSVEGQGTTFTIVLPIKNS